MAENRNLSSLGPFHFVAPTMSTEDCTTMPMPKKLSKTLRIIRIGAVRVSEEESQKKIQVDSTAASANVSASPSYPRKRQAEEMSHDAEDGKKQKMEEVGLYRASLHAPQTTCGSMASKEKKILNRCSGKIIKIMKPGSRQPDRWSLLGISVQKAFAENCVQYSPSIPGQAVQSCCSRASGSLITTLSDKSSKRSCPGHDRFGRSRFISIHRTLNLEGRFPDTIFNATHQENPNDVKKLDLTMVQKEKEWLERERKKESAEVQAKLKAASVRALNDWKLQCAKERAAARMALETLEETVEVVDDNFTAMKELKELCSLSKDEYGVGNPLQQLGLFLKQDYPEDGECSRANTPRGMH